MAKNFAEPVILGRTGLKVCRLGLASGYGVPAASAEKAFHEFGINYFYWNPQRKGMKQAMLKLVKTNRQDLVIAIQSYDHMGFFITRKIEKALKELQIDYVDVFIFGGYRSFPRQRVIDAAMKMREQGKVRFLGISGHNRKFFGSLLKKEDSPIDVLQVRYNAAHRGAEQEVFPFVPEKTRPGMTTYTATRWGYLLKQKRMPKGEKPLTASECYRFVLSNPNVDICMTGPKNEQQMDEALLTLEAGPLSDEEMERIKRIGDYVHRKSRFFM